MKNNLHSQRTIATIRHVTISGLVSLGLAAILAVVGPVLLAVFEVPWTSRWLWLAPGWALLKPGFDEPLLIFPATVISGACYLVVIWLLMFLALRRRTKQTNDLAGC